jgi:TonB family protein
MRYIILVFAIVFPSIVFGQTPTLLGEWSPELAGTIAHFTITSDEITMTVPSKMPALGAIMSMADRPQPAATAKNGPLVTKTEKVKILKIVYDSAQAKGRAFLQSEKGDAGIIPIRFVMTDNGELKFGLAGDILSKYSNSLKDLEKATRPSAKKPLKANVFGMNFGDLTFTLYNKTRAEAFAKLKDPSEISKAELLGMMNSFGNRLAAALQSISSESDTNNLFSAFGVMVPLIMNGKSVAQDLFMTHGYNPLGIVSCVEKYKDDSDMIAAKKSIKDKITESVPALRAIKKQEDSEPEKVAAPEAAPEKVEDFDLLVDPKPLDDVQKLVTYPEEAKKQGLQGRVGYSALIGVDGRVLKVEIMRSDNKIFDQAVKDAVMKARFTPAKDHEGKLAKVWYSQSVNFRLHADEEESDQH